MENLPRPNIDKGALTFDHEVNRLGRIIFLGTPFYEKSYGPKVSRAASRLWWLIDIPLITILGAAVYCFIIILYWAILWFFFQWLSFPKVQPNPLHWYLWAQVVIGLACFVGAMGAAQLWSPTAKNMYFEGKQIKELQKKGETFAYSPIQALVVSAGMLDEVFMAMSSEPLLYGILSPAIGDWLGAFPRLRIRKFSERVQNLSQRAVLMAWALVGQVFLYLPRLALYFCRRSLLRKVDDRLLGLLTSTGFGVPMLEFDRARIRVLSAPLSVPCLEPHFWSVSKDAAAFRFVSVDRARAEPSKARYAFLWDKDALASRIKESPLWKRVEPRLKDIETRYADVGESREDVKERLALVSLTLEERLKEAVGAVDLAHSSYYSSPRMLEAISDFIAAGTVPSAEEIRTEMDGAIPSVGAST
jgi:hypothetical protein